MQEEFPHKNRDQVKRSSGLKVQGHHKEDKRGYEGGVLIQEQGSSQKKFRSEGERTPQGTQRQTCRRSAHTRTGIKLKENQV